jgi:hypothetical protein
MVMNNCYFVPGENKFRAGLTKLDTDINGRLRDHENSVKRRTIMRSFDVHTGHESDGLSACPDAGMISTMIFCKEAPSSKYMKIFSKYHIKSRTTSVIGGQR